MNYNLRNLEPLEFEKLCKDIFNKTMGGMSQHILYESNKIVYLSNYNLTDDIILSNLNQIIK